MHRLLLAGTLLLFVPLSLVAEASACGRCGLFGRQCRFASSHVSHAYPSYAAPASTQVFNFVNSGFSALPLAAQGQSVYGYQLAAQAYAVDPSAVLSQAARLTTSAQALASDGFSGFTTLSQGQLEGQLSVARILAAGQANAAAITAAKSDVSTVQQFSFRATVQNGQMKVERLDGAEVQALSAPSDGTLEGVLAARCVACHSATSRNGLDLSDAATIDAATIDKILARVTTSDPARLMPRGKARLNAAELSPLFSRAHELRAK